MSKREMVEPYTEEQAIRALKRVAKRWPKSLWLFSASGSLEVMKCNEAGEQAMLPGLGAGVDPSYIIETIKGIPNDGGDW